MKRNYYHPELNKYKEVKVGFSWTVFFWGAIPMLCRGDWKSGICSIIVGLILNFSLPIIVIFPFSFYPATLMYFILAFFYNNYYEKNLIKQGYILK